MHEHSVIKPKDRHPLRRRIGKEVYILKRKFEQWRSKSIYATLQKAEYSNSVFEHSSLILRPLKDVEMYLQENKRTNLALALEKINGAIILPGQTFSFWRLVGRPTEGKGYKEGLILKQGKIDKGIGGGLCQLGNLLFWIIAHSPLTVTERHRHGYDVFPDVKRKVPFGAGATLAYNYIDLQFANETENPFQIKLWLSETHLHGRLSSQHKINKQYKVEERNHLITQQMWGGYTRHNQVYQISKDGNDNVSEKLLVENHAIMMYTPFLEEGS